MTARSPPVTRKKSAALRVYEDFPASPSEPAPSVPPPQVIRDASDQIASNSAAYEPTASTSRDVPRMETRIVSRAPSIRSHRSTASAVARIRQAEFEAEERLAEIRRQELQIQADLVRKRLAADVATIREETDRESIGANEAEQVESRVKDWLQHNAPRGESQEREPTDTETRYQSPTRREQRASEQGPSNKVTFEPTTRQRSPTPNKRSVSRDRGIERLAEALEQMARGRAPPRQTQDLPIFSGAPGEWLPFKAAMKESTSMHTFTPTENLARLRACLRGEARQTVSALLFTATEPTVIMKTLEQCYGRPEIIIDRALEEMKKLPRVGTTASELNSFAIKLQNIVTVISCIDERGYLQNPMLARQVTEKLSPHIRSRWCDYAEECGFQSEPEIITLSRFLMREADRAMRHTYAATTATKNTVEIRAERQPRTQDRTRSAVYATAETTKKSECLCCGGKHGTTECRKLIDMPIEKRWEWAKEARICFKCMNSKHRRFNCKVKSCGFGECRRPHHRLLHTPEYEKTAHEDSAITATAHAHHTNEVLLKVCPITIKGRSGEELKTYALLDEGSTITLIDEEIAAMVGAKGPTRTLRIVGATSSRTEPESQVVDINIRGNNERNCHHIKARTVKNLILGSQTIGAEVMRLGHMQNLPPEVVCYTNAKPRVLIGADNWHLIVTRKLLTGRRNQPAASLTELGWVIHGSTPRSTVMNKNETVLHIRTEPQRDEDLGKLVEAHFSLDSLGITAKRKPIPSEERAVEIFERTARRINGRFEVGLPWARDYVKMPPSYDMALRRLRSIEKKMDNSPEFAYAYVTQIENLFKKGYAAKSEEDGTNPRLWYLPHFAVTNPNKPGKIRVVFDAAARANETCLNDVLLDGPDLLQSLFSVLFRFRDKPVAVTADIREMFLQVKIRKEDQPAQHFLWRGNDRSSPPSKYVMTSMIFGARSSPFVAHSVRNKNALDFKSSHPLAFESITRNHYMDDWVESFDTEEIAARTVAEVREVHSRAGFELASWSSNYEYVLNGIPNEQRAHAPKELAANAHPYGKTLGILWLTNTDELAFNTNMNRVPTDVKNAARTPSKREALGAVMSLFDPLGLLSPYTITAKIMLQELWKKKIDWDDQLPPEEAVTFSEWQADLRYITDLRIPRCYHAKSSESQRQLHIFCDASEQAYAAVGYWRFENDNDVTVRIVAGKAKVAPMKAQSIPRMELQASLIGARLAAEIIKSHNVEAEITYWSDSKTVLHWIRNDTVRYTPYVAHRLSEIAELTRPEQWRWVPTKLNVADDATRSGNTQLRNEDRWFVGPSFLYEDPERWPEETEFSQKRNEIDEVVVTHVIENPIPRRLIDMTRFSSYERMVRALSYALAFIDKCRGRAKERAIRHIHQAESLLVSDAQRESFPIEYERLKRGERVDRTSRLYKLDPYYDDGIIRLNGRINAATVPEYTKNPPILDGKHRLAELLIDQEHVTNKHVGREQIVNNLRQRFWILRLRPAVRQRLNKCTWCAVRRASPKAPVKGDLPKIRLDSYVRPFSTCGIDGFGPMWVTIGRRREKRWGLLFTCMVTRAIHVELIATLSTDSAIMAIRRMAARRGMPSIIISDNGTNFHGSNVELERAYKEWQPALKEYVLAKRVEWRFIDPGAPNQGGAWERMIKSVKTALAVTLNERAPKEEVLLTLLTEIEHTINSRPLTHVSVEPSDNEALTPNHFLLGSSNGMPYVGECHAADKRSWRAAQALANSFWARWIKEYLPTLAPRGDVRKHQENVKPGDIVIIADGLLPRNVWPRGQVEQVFPGPDGVVRSANVRTRGGIFRRPVRRLIVLPIEVKGYEGLRRGETVKDR